MTVDLYFRCRPIVASEKDAWKRYYVGRTEIAQRIKVKWKQKPTKIYHLYAQNGDRPPVIALKESLPSDKKNDEYEIGRILIEPP